MIPYYYVVQCPLVHQCTTAAFKRSQCWDYTEDGARQRLIRHLEVSELHRCNAKDARILADDAEIEEAEMEPLPNSPKLPIGARVKRPRSPSASPPRRSPSPQQPPSSSSHDDHKRRQICLPASIAGSHSGSKPSGYFLPSQQVGQILDSVKRAEAAARHAQLLAASAAKAFAGELNALTAVRTSLEETLLHAELDSIGDTGDM
jgi:hypothetical protein